MNKIKIIIKTAKLFSKYALHKFVIILKTFSSSEVLLFKKRKKNKSIKKTKWKNIISKLLKKILFKKL